MHGGDRTAGGGGGGHFKETGAGDTEADLLAFHIAAFDPQLGQLRGAVDFGPLENAKGHHQKQEHDRQQRPTLAGIADHAAEGGGETGRDQQNEQDLQQMGERGRILKGMGRVGIEEAAAVGAQFLDRLLGSDRSHGDTDLAHDHRVG